MALMLEIEPKKGISLWSEQYSKIIISFAWLCHFKTDALLNARAIMAKVKHQNSRVVLTSIALIFTLNSYVAMAQFPLNSPWNLSRQIFV